MDKKINYAWRYRLVHADNAFSVYIDDRLVAMILKPSSGKWPVYATINERMYCFSKKNNSGTLIEIADAVSNDVIGFIKMPWLSSFFPHAVFKNINGDETKWSAKNFFSLHWRWIKNKESVVEAIDNLVLGSNSGVISAPEYKNGTDLMIITGFFLSLLRRSKLSMGARGLKRNNFSFSKEKDS